MGPFELYKPSYDLEHFLTQVAHAVASLLLLLSITASKLI